MSLPSYAVTDDDELETASRDRTSYDTEELPGSHDRGQMAGIMQDAKRYMHAKTGSDGWYGDLAFGQALVALTAMKMKEAVENVNISSYGIGDETVAFTDTDPETSQQIVSWSEEMNEMLDVSDVDLSNTDMGLRNTGSYIG